jgi:hypothetical protein
MLADIVTASFANGNRHDFSADVWADEEAWAQSEAWADVLKRAEAPLAPPIIRLHAPPARESDAESGSLLLGLAQKRAMVIITTTERVPAYMMGIGPVLATDNLNWKPEIADPVYGQMTGPLSGPPPHPQVDSRLEGLLASIAGEATVTLRVNARAAFWAIWGFETTGSDITPWQSIASAWLLPWASHLGVAIADHPEAFASCLTGGLDRDPRFEQFVLAG